MLKESSRDIKKLSIKTHGNGNATNSGNAQPAVTPRASSFSSGQLLLQRRQFAESQIGRTSFQKLLEPSSSQIPGLAPYRVVLGDVKEKVLFWFQTSETMKISSYYNLSIAVNNLSLTRMKVTFLSKVASFPPSYV